MTGYRTSTLTWGPGKMLMGDPYRQCQHCGAIQQQVTSHAWMRVTGRRWLPLVGRCAEVTAPLDWQVALHGTKKATVQARHQPKLYCWPNKLTI